MLIVTGYIFYKKNEEKKEMKWMPSTAETPATTVVISYIVNGLTVTVNDQYRAECRWKLKIAKERIEKLKIEIAKDLGWAQKHEALLHCAHSCTVPLFYVVIVQSVALRCLLLTMLIATCCSFYRCRIHLTAFPAT